MAHTMKTIKLSKNNRNINENHVARLMDSIQAEGYIDALPIIVDKDGYIIDGQHRFIACTRLKVDAPIVEGDPELIPLINSTQLKWSLNDFINYYAGKGYPDYIVLRNLCEAKGISPSNAVTIITGKPLANVKTDERRVYGSKLKYGTFKFDSISPKALQKAENRIDKVLGLIEAMGLRKSERLVTSITKLIVDKNFDFKTMHTKIAYQKSKIHRCTTIPEYIEMMTSIYNYKNSKKIFV